MNNFKNKELIAIKPTFQRYVAIDENIHEALSLHSFSLYMVLRYHADFSKEDSEKIHSAKFLYTKAKIKRSQYFKSMNELEENGLVFRDPENKVGEKCLIHVARELNYFTGGNNKIDEPVHTVDTPVHTVDTYHYSSSSNIINNIASESCSSSKEKTQKSKALMEEMITVYREEFPDNPQPHPKVISTSLQKTMQTLIKRWPELDPGGKALDIHAFRRYLNLLRTTAPKFSLGEYVTEDGNRKKNNLETFCRWNTIVKFLERAYT